MIKLNMNLGTRTLIGTVIKRIGSIPQRSSVRKYHKDFYYHHHTRKETTNGNGTTTAIIRTALSAVCGVGVIVASSSSLGVLDHDHDVTRKNGGMLWICGCEKNSEEADQFQRTLRHHQRLLEVYKRKWDWNRVNSRIPTASWPYNIPSEKDIGMFRTEMLYCNKSSISRSSSDNDEYCDSTRFRVATYWMQNGSEQEKFDAMKIIKELAEQRNHADAMCSYAICWNEGRGGLEVNPGLAVSWWKLAQDKHCHVQSTYELGVALYTGEGIPEDESQAVNIFRHAADNGHAGAAYMLGDCLLDGIGCERDRAEALEWLVVAADLGHRGARSRVLAVLEKKEKVNYGRFTDASRQTFVEHTTPNSSSSTTPKSGENKDTTTNATATTMTRMPQERPLLYERKFTIGGGARNPAVLARRKTIVVESRQQ